jgi:hypothetical protein
MGPGSGTLLSHNRHVVSGKGQMLVSTGGEA